MPVSGSVLCGALTVHMLLRLTLDFEQAKLVAEGVQQGNLDSKEKEEVMQLSLQLGKLKAESELLQQQLKRRMPVKA